MPVSTWTVGSGAGQGEPRAAGPSSLPRRLQGRVVCGPPEPHTCADHALGPFIVPGPPPTTRPCCIEPPVTAAVFRAVAEWQRPQSPICPEVRSSRRQAFAGPRSSSTGRRVVISREDDGSVHAGGAPRHQAALALDVLLTGR